MAKPFTVYLDNDHPAAETIETLPWSEWCYRWSTLLTSQLPEAIAYELGLRLTDDSGIHQLNHQYRHQDKPTDVLAFAALENEAPPLPPEIQEPLYLGDIIVSLDTAQRQAQEQNHDLKLELTWLVAHGFLHLLGWDHPDDDSLGAMLHQQKILLNAIGLASPHPGFAP